MKSSFRKVALLSLSGLIISSCGRANVSPVYPPFPVQPAQTLNGSYSADSWSNGKQSPPLSNAPITTTGNKTKLLVDGEQIFPEIHNIIAGAKRKIQVTTYLFGEKVGHDLAIKLIEKSKEGVEIQFVADPSMGSIPALTGPAKKEYDFLIKNGVEVRDYPVDLLPKGPTFLSNQKLINHSKMVIADEEIAVIGGMNLKSTEAINHDYMVRLEGPAAKQLANIIDFNWHKSRPMKINSLDNEPIPQEPPSIINSYNVQIAQTGLREQSIDDMLISHFNQARHSIFIEMLLLDHQEVVKALAAAKDRGVDVRIILSEVDPGKYNKVLDKLPLEGITNFGAMTLLMDHKIPVKWYVSRKEHEMLHAKAAVIDNEVFITGSANYTYHALTRNHEVSIAIKDAALAADFTRVFLNDWQVQSKEVKLSWTQKLLGKAFRKVANLIYKNKSEEEMKSLILTNK